MSAPILFVIAFSVVSSTLSLLYVLVFFFPGPCSGACSVTYPGILAKFVNKQIKYLMYTLVAFLQTHAHTLKYLTYFNNLFCFQ